MEDAEKLAPYYGQTLRWPKLAEARPCLPFMRLLAWRMMTASLTFPPTTDSASATHKRDVPVWHDEEALSVSASPEAKAALQSLVARYNLV